MVDKRSTERNTNTNERIFDKLRHLGDRLERHMEHEERMISEAAEERRIIMEELGKIREPLSDIMESMPRDIDTNEPSLYLHRVQHSVLSDGYKLKSKFWDGVAEKAGTMFMIFLIVLLASAPWSKIIASLTGG